MKEKQGVSQLMLERYHLGEISFGEKERIEVLLNMDGAFRDRLERLEESDRELRLSCPLGSFPVLEQALRHPAKTRRFLRKDNRTVKPFFLAVCAAVLLVCMLFPVLHVFSVPGLSPGTDRPK